MGVVVVVVVVVVVMVEYFHGLCIEPLTLVTRITRLSLTDMPSAVLVQQSLFHMSF